MRPLKLLAGLALLPLCVAATRAIFDVARTLAGAEVLGVPAGLWWLVGGLAFWMFLFLATPRPVRTYVLAHELTHALWGLAMGARVSRLRVTAKGGSVALSKTNFLITLAPYFFPFYTWCVIAAYAVVALWSTNRTYEPFWLFLIGLTWGFHLTFTVTTLLEHQPDIAENGRVFSYVVIYLMNVIGIGLWVVAVATPRLTFLSAALWGHTLDAYGAVLAAAGALLQWLGRRTAG